MKNVKRARKALADSQAAWNSTMHKKEEEIVTLYTLAPETLDKPGTVSVGSYWLYSDDNVPEQVLREVLVDKDSSVAQMQAYRLKIPYITFSEEGLNKALKKGLVYRKDETEEENAIVAGIDATIATIENELQETEEKVTMARNKAPKTPTTPAPASKEEAFYDGIASAIEEEEFPLYRLEDDPKYRELLAMVVHMQEAMLILMAKVDTLEARGCGEETPQVPVPVDTIADAWGSMMDMEAPKAQVPVPCDPMGDAWGSLMDTPKVPAKPKSTLILGPNVPKAPKAPARDIPGNNGKVPVDTIIAIQTAWKNKTATQAELAAKYGMDDKKVWYFCNRAKQLV